MSDDAYSGYEMVEYKVPKGYEIYEGNLKKFAIEKIHMALSDMGFDKYTVINHKRGLDVLLFRKK